MSALVDDVLEHYNTRTGFGNIYRFWASWPNVIRAILFGWEGALDHPAQLHYALDFDGSNLDSAISRAAHEACAALELKNELAVVVDAGCGLGGASLVLARVHPSVQFIGYSISPEQVEIAKRRARNARVHNVGMWLAITHHYLLIRHRLMASLD